MENNQLEGWVFTKVAGIWNATTRDNYFELFNGEKGNTLRSKNFEDIESLIVKAHGDLNIAKRMIDGK